MTHRFLSSRLAAHAGTRNAELLVRADHAGDEIGKAVRFTRLEILERMKPGVHNQAANFHTAFAILQHLPSQIWHSLRISTGTLLLWSHDQAANAMIRTLPRDYLRAAAMAGRFRESSEHGRQRVLRLIEDEHGPVQFSVQQTPDGPTFFTHDPTLSAGQETEMWRRWLFPPPDADVVRSILDQLLPPRFVQGSLFDTLGTAEDPITPMSLAGKIAEGFAAGKTTTEVGREIRPYFEGSSMRAERTARTLGAYVGTERNLATSEALGTLVIGYQVHNPGGENARHEHALRSGTVYYKNPTAGQWGMDTLPHPPIDTQRGPHDDMGAPNGWCFNCRCWITPVLRRLDAMDSSAFTDNADKLIPDVSHFADWFASATPKQRQKAAGVRRLSTAQDVLGRPATWADLVHPDTGKLLSVDELKGESEQRRAERRAKVTAAISINRALVKRVATTGSV